MNRSKRNGFRKLNSLREMAIEARDSILERKILQPQVAIILGSGLGSLATQVEHACHIPYESIPFFSQPTAAGHAGELILGFVSGLPVAVLHGRCHRYEGFANYEVSFPVYCLHALGARTLITTNAAGGLNRRYQAGDLMVIDSHIDLMWPRTGNRTRPELPVEEGPITDSHSPRCYDFSLIEQVKMIARQKNTVLHQGCYLGTLGPTYETRSEYRMFRWMGADAVGMSTIPEIRAAGRLRMSALAFSVITNVASTDVPNSTTHEEVLNAGQEAGPKLIQVIRQLLENISGQPD